MTDPAQSAREAARQAGIERRAGHLAEAVGLQRTAVAHAEASGNPELIAHTLRHLAEILSESGEPQAALPLFEQVLAFYAPGMMPQLDTANALRAAALNAERLHQADAARSLWNRARALYDTLGIVEGVTEADAHLASG